MAGVVKLLTFAICVIRCESQGFDYWTEDWTYRCQIGLDWTIMDVRNGNPHHHQHVHNHHLHQHQFKILMNITILLIVVSSLCLVLASIGVCVCLRKSKFAPQTFSHLIKFCFNLLEK